MELLKPLAFIGERLAGGAWARLADLVMQETVEAPTPVMAAIYYFPDRTPPEDQAA